MANVYKLERMPQSSDLYSTEEAIKVFGRPNQDPKLCEVRPRMVMIETPFKLRLYDRGGVASVTRISCHKIVAPYFEAALCRTLDHYGLSQIVALGLDVYGGCHNARPIRGGKDWSKHAFAIASDWLPRENGLKTPFEQSRFGQPIYKAYLDIWQECGFANLGRVATFARDAMHFEFMKTPGKEI